MIRCGCQARVVACSVVLCSALAWLPQLVSAQPLGLRDQLRLFGIGALQRPVGLDLGALSATFSGRHVFIGLSYQRAITPKVRLGFGAGLSYGAFGVKLKGQYTDSSGSYLVSDERWSRMRWYPFERGFTGPYSWRTDPFHIWIEAIREFSPNERGSKWEASLLLGALSPLGVFYTVSSDVPSPQPGSAEPVFASTTLGDSWHPMAGMALERVFMMRNLDGLSLGLDWRFSLDGYFHHDIGLRTSSGDLEFAIRSSRFMWFGIRAGYCFTWGKGRKPRWMRLREERGLPLDR